MPDSFADFYNAAASSGIGAALGTLVKLFRQPPTSWVRWIGQSFTAIFVGTLAGGLAAEYFDWSVWAVSSTAACAAYVSDEIIRMIENNGRRLRDVRPPLPFNKDQGEDHGA